MDGSVADPLPGFWMGLYPEASTGTISSGKEYAFNRQAHEPCGALAKPCVVRVEMASLRGLTPEIREHTTGKAAHPMEVYGGEKQESR
jgi:hypothetical protein